MTTYNTGNPIGSTDARDRSDNSENMDILENSTTKLTHPDRLGTVRKTRHGMEVEHDAQIAAHESEHDAQIAAHESEHDAQMQSFESDFSGRLAGMAFTRVGSFTDGATLTDMRQVLVWEASQGGDGHEYSWAGTFPKVVAAGATPATSGGVGAGAWVDRTDVTLRGELITTGSPDLVDDSRVKVQQPFAGAVVESQHDINSKWLNGSSFGIVADGVANDTAAVNNAFAAMLSSNRPLRLPHGTIMVDADSLVIGDGSAAQSSTKQVFFLAGSGFAPYTRKGTVIKARTPGNTLLKINGLIEGTVMHDIQFDCAGIVQDGIVANTIVGANWERFGIYDWINSGLKLLNRTLPAASVTWSRDNMFKQFFITSAYNGDFSSGLFLSGIIDPVTPPGPQDMHHSIFDIGTIQLNKTVNGCQAIYLGFTDSNQFREVDTILVGTGIGRGVTFTDQDNVGMPYPQNNLFTGCSLGGDSPLVIGSPGRNYLFHYAQKDGENLPSNTFVVRGMTDEGYFFGPHGFEVINTELLLQGGTIAKRRITFTTPDGTMGARVQHNNQYGLELQVFNGTGYDTIVRLLPNGQIFMNIDGVGFRQIQAGNPDSAGTGFRTLRIPN
jgi:hypothetical protein